MWKKKHILVASTNSDNFIDIYNQLLDNYKMFSTKGKHTKTFMTVKKPKKNLNES